MSKIEVNTVDAQCGTTVTVGSAGKTVAVPGNIIKSNALQAADGGSIISQSGTTITLGASGDSIALASGASQTGFGRTGTVDWQTGSIKTATFTAANGEGYFANTSGGGFTMNLPAGTAGNIVSVVDYTNTFQTNNLTIAPNGSEKIGGIASSIALNTEGQSVTFVYVDATEGWKNTMDSRSNVTGNPFLQATGGTITTCGNDKIHTFTGPGTFAVSSISQTAPENIVSYMVIAGGGGNIGPGHYNGGGGAGGFREFRGPAQSYNVSPLNGSTPITVTATSFPITVGAGGGASGTPSTALGITSTGGGGGGKPGCAQGNSGGSGGGGSPFTPAGAQPGGAGNTPPVSPSQGNAGGIGNVSSPFGGAASGGGGGAGAPGNNANTANPITSGGGGAGVATSISGSSVTRAGGGGGAAYSGTGSMPPTNPGFPGGGGGGGNYPNNPASTNGTANTGGGGGGDAGFTGPTGGSGIVIIRYKFQ